jgi:hypothetical protein
MPSGYLTPDARLRVFSDLSVVLPGARLHTYVAGTPSTPLATYSDSALTIPNANPIIADAFGLFGPIYLTPGTAYKLVLGDTTDVTIWTQDNVAVPASATLAAGAGISLVTVAGVTTIAATATSSTPSIGTNDFRLTLESGVPVSSADQLAKTTVYATPYRGNRIDLYDAAGVPTTIVSAEFSIALPAVASKLYDIFAFNNAGVATLELLAWTNDTTRATALVRTTTGTWTKTGDLTRRYLGSIRTTTVAGQSEDSLANRLLWNVSNRVQRPLRVVDTTDSWTYDTATYRQARATATNQVAVVVGIAEALLELTARHLAGNNSGAGVNIATSIGEDSTTTPATGVITSIAAANGTVGMTAACHAILNKIPAVGYHFFAWLEYGGLATTTWYGDAGATVYQTGLSGSVEG